MAHSVWRAAHLFLVAVLFFGLSLIVAPSAAAADIKSLEPTENEGEYRVESSGFTPGEKVSVRLIGPSEQVVKLDRDTASKRGHANFTFFMPRYYESGEWTLRLEGVDSDKKTKETFELPYRGPNVPLAVTPTEGPTGTTFTFTSASFDPGERVSTWVTLPNGESITIDDTRANEAGQIAFTVIAPPGAPTGDWAGVAYGQRSDRLGTVAFNVTL